MERHGDVRACGTQAALVLLDTFRRGAIIPDGRVVANVCIVQVVFVGDKRVGGGR